MSGREEPAVEFTCSKVVRSMTAFEVNSSDCLDVLVLRERC